MYRQVWKQVCLKVDCDVDLVEFFGFKVRASEAATAAALVSHYKH